MVAVTKGPVGTDGYVSGVERMGDFTPLGPGNKEGSLVWPYPTQPGQVVTYASWKDGATSWSASTTIGNKEHFQLSADGTGLECERSGALMFRIWQGLI